MRSRVPRPSQHNRPTRSVVITGFCRALIVVLLGVFGALNLACPTDPPPPCSTPGCFAVPDTGVADQGVDTNRPTCGDGVIEGLEQCDGTVDQMDCWIVAGTRQGELLCNFDCTWNTSQCVGSVGCGDGELQESEECDPGLPSSIPDCEDFQLLSGSVDCSAACELRLRCLPPPANCGDNLLASVEECDDGNRIDLDGCSADCEFEYCGDGLISSAVGEWCETGIDLEHNCQDFGFVGGDLSCDTSSCVYDTTGCDRPVCGDGDVQGGEECDDDNLDDYDGCSSICMVERCVRGYDHDGDEIDDCDDVEECDGIDNNGNGAIDEYVSDSSVDEACYTGTGDTRQEGECADGRIGCANGILVCLGEALPREELCNGLDDNCDGSVPNDESACGVFASLSADESVPLQFQLRPEYSAVDVVLSLDTTRSMGDELAGLQADLRDIIVPAVEASFSDPAFAVTSFADFPFGDFGREGDMPFRLVQRVTTNTETVQQALNGLVLTSGGDLPESGVEAIHQIATGDGVAWPVELGKVSVEVLLSPDNAVGPVAVLHRGDIDDYLIDVPPGTVLEAQILGRRFGSRADTVLRVFTATGDELAENDDSFGLDPAVRVPLAGQGPYVVRVEGCCGDGTAAGWYILSLRLNGEPYLPDVADDEYACSALEVGGDSLQGENAVLMTWAGNMLPFDSAACVEDCTEVVEDIPIPWLRSYCGDGGPLTQCGDGVVGYAELCDDGNLVRGDGCDERCHPEINGVPAFDSRLGFSPSQGHGLGGGVGFRSHALPLVLHFTDSLAHNGADYRDYDPNVGAHDATDALDALGSIGGVVLGISSGSRATSLDDVIHDLDGMAISTGAVVPACAFDDTPARLDDDCSVTQCCTGIDGEGQFAINVEGDCPLVFNIRGDGTGLSEAVVSGITYLADFAGFSVTGRVRPGVGAPDAVVCLAHRIDVSEVVSGGAVDCVPNFQQLDLDEDEGRETLLDASRGLIATFSLNLQNTDSNDWDGDEDIAESCVGVGTYPLVFELVDPFEHVLASQILTVEVTE